MNTIHLPATKGHKWAKMNEKTQLLEFFTCVDSGYYKEEDYELVTDAFMHQYINENYPKPEDNEVPVTGGEDEEPHTLNEEEPHTTNEELVTE